MSGPPPHDRGASDSKRIRAAEYVRMSTEHQRYSTENQADAIRAYAVRRSIEIVTTYADRGKSGLRLDGRDALKRLIDDVQSGRAEFEAILVYDVSRWGRFQDADESAYYEYVCKRAGITVHYCAEQFENDGSPISTIIKGVKRAMAGEYSRELSAKVFAGQCRLIELGFKQGGSPGFGLRRALVDQYGSVKGRLGRGEQKGLQTDRVVLEAGPADEVAIVREIFRRFVENGEGESSIAAALNSSGRCRATGCQWTRGTVHQILINENYIGNNVWNRVSFKLKQRRVRNPREMWVRSQAVFPSLVDRMLFDAAQAIIASRSARLTDEQMLDPLRRLRERVGSLSGIIIDEAEGIPSSAAYRSRFGSLLRAYALIGYTPRRDYRYVEINRDLRALHPRVVESIVARLRQTGAPIAVNSDTGIITVSGEVKLSIVIARCRRRPSGSYRWHMRFDAALKPDITVAVRMNAENSAALDYFLLPALDVAAGNLRLREENALDVEAYRFDTLEPLFAFLTPVDIAEVA